MIMYYLFFTSVDHFEGALVHDCIAKRNTCDWVILERQRFIWLTTLVARKYKGKELAWGYLCHNLADRNRENVGHMEREQYRSSYLPFITSTLIRMTSQNSLMSLKFCPCLLDLTTSWFHYTEDQTPKHESLEINHYPNHNIPFLAPKVHVFLTYKMQSPHSNSLKNLNLFQHLFKKF